MKKEIIIASAAAVVLGGLQYHMDITEISIPSEKVTKPVTICVLSDLHCRWFGKKQEKIMREVRRRDPDLIVIPGDLFDVDRDFSVSFELLDLLRGRNVFYVSGNHDRYLKELPQLYEQMEEMGVIIPEEESFQYGEIEIVGLKDLGRKTSLKGEEVNRRFQTDGFRLLLSHRPNYISLYEQLNCDLIICGHAHGGQFRIPFTHQGIIAPQQGLFPKYTEGLHQMGTAKLFISRGLASGDPHVPRLYNNPEIAFLTIVPKEEKE